MRMRRKKHLDERLGAVCGYLFESDIDDRNFKTAVSDKEYIDIDKWFGRSAPCQLEIGCGKGGFAVEYALLHPEVNLIAVEKSANVIVEAAETAKSRGIENVRFMKTGAEYLEKYLKESSIERIFLNFSCPFPKKSYTSHRLTNKSFLEIYKRLMKEGAEIHQKTDNMHFFEFSLEQFTLCGFSLKNVSLDLHNSGFEGNIETEYEHKFSSLGKPIYRLEAYINNDRGKL